MEAQPTLPLSVKTPESHFQKTISLIRKYQNFLICTHINPDPDALSSQLALAMVLKSLGKKVLVLSSEKTPHRFRFLPGSEMIRTGSPGRLPYEVALIVDCGDLSRIGKMQELIQPEKILVNIDHHITNELFGTLNLVIPEASSTAEVLFDLFQKMRIPLTEEMAILLYLGIMTDTGSFRYDNTTAHTHRVIATLMKFPVPVSRLYQVLYETIPLTDIRYFTHLVRKFDSLCRGRVICVELKKKTLEKFSDEFDLRDKVFRHFRAIKGVEVILILTEEASRRTRINLRSLQHVDVGRLAYQFKGGGHSRASGCMLEVDMKTARNQILTEIKKAL